MSLPTRTLGKNGPKVSAIGFGLMAMSGMYNAPLDDEAGFALLDKAIELGATFWDTSNIYGGSEDQLNRYFKARPGAREKVFLATKFGFALVDGGVGAKNDVDYIRECGNGALARLGVDYIDLFYVHRIDPKQPIETTMKALLELKNEGKIRHIGLSEASAETLRRANAVTQVAAHQVEYSPFELSVEHDDINVLKVARELGIATVAYSPLSRGLLTGQVRSTADFPPTDFRRTIPRFSDENFPKNLAVVDKFVDAAKKHKATASQVALAWLLAQGEDVIPIPGTSRIANLEENIGAASVKLSGAELQELSTVVRAADVVGNRYGPGMDNMVYITTVPL